MTNTILIFYSNTGNTARVAEQIASVIPLDVYEVTLNDPTLPDKMLQRPGSSATARNNHELPSLKAPLPDVSQYNNVILGYPIWSNGVALPIVSLLEQIDLTEKEIYPFSTSGGSGLGNSINYLRDVLPNSNVHNGFTAGRWSGSALPAIKKLANQLSAV
ncbi:flavodoxin [Agrilactobacillus yilanensis]|uniref:Flavodoxin n=1 Tax=Agrilactobacillus yilanensis TaxID=2485997 RepID=A0ABW4J425_9LACO|nr:flavodoxin [Agrilactobacillus yilanensis]